ncbi:helix-turn-helix domain-containing protein [Sinimarinibacterium flocculans]|uniref:helix-turn-helix domain-containing protein n=1 Tax=Sinimarinibacterium flocculans TaxID=985250 RepID=UPI000D7737CE|nr:helix-turn-helix transcriptional regulator [Sinimarinibacterium flocculans]
MEQDADRIRRAFGLALKSCRTACAISQEALALSAGVDRTFVSLLERGLRQPTLETLFRLAAVLDTSPEAMVAMTRQNLTRSPANRARRQSNALSK